MGMMLETTSRRLWSEPGNPHFGSPDKETGGPPPGVGPTPVASGVPFTTGILIGNWRDSDRTGRVAVRDPVERP